MKALAIAFAVLPLLVTTTLAADLKDMHDYHGMCDASAILPVGDGYFWAANDEDNTLRLYRRGEAAIVKEFSLDPYLDLEEDHPEADLEASARIGDTVYWITSFGNNKDGKKRPNRRRFFATKLEGTGAAATLTLVGEPVKKKLFNVITEKVTDYPWDDVERLAPEAPGGVNIEGLAATPEGTLWIAFRNPVPNNKALLVELKNPAETVQGEDPAIGRVARLDLSGNGVRSIEYWPAEKAFLVVAGPSNDDGEYRLWRWSGKENEPPTKLPIEPLTNCTPEAVAFADGQSVQLFVLSDDGGRPLTPGGKDCKELPAAERRFRAGWVQLPSGSP